jgi:hypothetical protein
MAINPMPPKSVTNFITGAPDAPQTAKGFPAGKQSQISLAMPPELLDKVDEAARALSLSRAGFIKMCLSNAVNKG